MGDTASSSSAKPTESSFSFGDIKQADPSYYGRLMGNPFFAQIAQNPAFASAFTGGLSAPQTQQLATYVQGTPGASAFFTGLPGYDPDVGAAALNQGLSGDQFRGFLRSTAGGITGGDRPDLWEPAPGGGAPGGGDGAGAVDPNAVYQRILSDPNFNTAIQQGLTPAQTQALATYMRSIPGAEAWLRGLPGYTDVLGTQMLASGMTAQQFRDFMRAVRFGVTGQDAPWEVPGGGGGGGGGGDEGGKTSGPPGETLTGLGPMMDALRAIEFYNERFGPNAWRMLLDQARPEIRSRLLGARTLQIPNLPYIPAAEDVGFGFGG
jgi:hypothetical protein